MLDSLLNGAHALIDQWGHNEAALDGMRVVLVNLYVPTMGALAALTAAALVVARRPIVERLRSISPRALTWALVLFNVALALRLVLVVHMPQVYFDEISFLDTSENMARHDLNLLTPGDPSSDMIFHPCPAGWQYMISRAYRIFGVHPDVAFTLASLLSSLSVPLLFLVLREATGRSRVGLWGALFLAVLPVHLRLSGSSALETPSVFFLLATLYATLVWSATRARSALLLAATLFAWFANMRMENSFALGPLLALYAALHWPADTRGSAERRTAAGCALVALFFSMPALLADAYGIVTRFYFFYQPPKITQLQVASNWQGNIPYWLDNRFHPAMLTMLAATGLCLGLARPATRREAGFWGTWTAGLVVFYTLNPSCDFALRHTLDSWRTAIHPALGVIVLAALGTQALIDAATSRTLRAAVGVVTVTTALATPWLFEDFLSMRNMWMLQWEALIRMRQEMPPDAYLLIYDHSTALGPSSPGMAYEIGVTTGVTPHFFVFPDDWRPGNVSATPQIARDVEQWKVEKRKMFLYHLDAGRVQDAHDLALMRSLLDLRPVAGVSMRSNHATFSLWRIEGAAPQVVSAPERKAPR